MSIPFKLEMRNNSQTLVWDNGATQPATPAEVMLWSELSTLRRTFGQSLDAIAEMAAKADKLVKEHRPKAPIAAATPGTAPATVVPLPTSSVKGPSSPTPSSAAAPSPLKAPEKPGAVISTSASPSPSPATIPKPETPDERKERLRKQFGRRDPAAAAGSPVAGPAGKLP